jgi:radical SAM superfamily enzyme YgiQ (UPF0313 family)
MQPQVLFHQLPPVDVRQPDIALTILKGHLGAHGISSRIIYWNQLLDPLYDQLRSWRSGSDGPLGGDIESRPSVFAVGPFLLDLLRDEDNPRSAHARAGLLSYYASLFPRLVARDPAALSTILDDLRSSLVSRLTAELERLPLDETLLWAISCKLNQWVPGLVLTRLALKQNPSLRVVIGGVPSRSAAMTMLRVFLGARYAIWGEGEGPLLSLIRHIAGDGSVIEAVPRLVYRSGDELVVSQVDSPDTGPLIADDLSDFFTTREQLPSTSRPVEVALNTVRGCYWGRCRFCNLHQNLSHRHKEPEQVVNEIREISTRYGVNKITFANMDINDPNSRRFDELLGRMAALRLEEDVDVEYSADISASHLSSARMRAMALAGFTHFLIGFEAMTDGLLEKIRKRHRFAHNLCFLKLSDKYCIQEEVNILMGVPDETSDDVIESIHNLHYLRFYPPGRRGQLWIRPLFLGAGAPYEADLSEADRARWVIDDAYSVHGFLPEGIAMAGDRMELGAFRAPLLHGDLWDQFKILMRGYQEIRREYRWIPRGQEVILHESIGSEIVKEFVLEPETYEVLRLANDTVVSFADLEREMRRLFSSMDDSRLVQIVESLKGEYLLYADTKLNNIIAVVDTDRGPQPDR